MKKTTKTVISLVTSIIFMLVALAAITYVFIMVLFGILYGVGWMLWGI